jgi:phosphoglycolate phosphatase-like HAD superfamily hydrolase
MDYQTSLHDLKANHAFFIGIDSDGCVFDTMEIKQKEYFIPVALEQFNLAKISKELRETWEFVNLYSIYRGGNRFISLVKVFELLKERKTVNESGCKLPDLSSLKKWVSIENRLSNSTLRKYFEENYDPELEKVVLWTETINKNISTGLCKIPPFPNALEAIKTVSLTADLIVVSQTPLEALEREWSDHDMKKFVSVIAGQEHGTKTEHLRYAAKDKYPPDKILMIGDAPGDLNAASNNGILFYPIIPGKEDKSWERFNEEALVKFTGGTFKGSYEKDLLIEFKRALPEVPPWS